MNTQFTKEELGNILTLLNRVEIKGGEAIPMAMLLQKIAGLVNVKKENKPESEKSLKKT